MKAAYFEKPGTPDALQFGEIPDSKPGSDFADVVLEAAGSYAEKAVTYTRVLRHIPDGLSFETMGAIPVGALTAPNGLYLCGDEGRAAYQSLKDGGHAGKVRITN